MSQRFTLESKYSPMSRREFLAASAAVPAAALSACTSQSGSKQGEPVGPARLVDAAGEKVSFFAGERPLFEYRYSAAHPKTYVHPLYAPNGFTVTLDSPADHVHHRGIMLAWSNVNGFDFWGELTPGRHGQIVHQRFLNTSEKPLATVTALNHWVAEGAVLLAEQQTLTAPIETADAVWLEWDSELQAQEADVTLSAAEAEYNGLGIRFARSMDGDQILNAQGMTEIVKANGATAEWCSYCGPMDNGELCGVAVFDHPQNPRHPNPFFVMSDPFGYVSAAPTFREPFEIKAGQSLRLRYALVSYLGAADRQRLDRLYQSWVAA